VSTRQTRLEALLRHDRAVILAAIALLTLAAWAYLADLVRGMGTMDRCGPIELALLLVMWLAMMVAMMLPTAAPLVLMFARANRQQGARRVVQPAGILLLGYLLAWTGYSAVAAMAQWRLHATAFLSPLMASTSPMLEGFLLLAAGAYQFTPLKRACLVRCRSPLSFLLSGWRDGRWGTLAMGLRHGAYCVGCCWLLMALMFAAGVMSLPWMAALAVFVLAEKIVPRGDLIARLAGAALIAAAIALLGAAWGAAALLLWGAGLSLREALDKRSPLSLYLNDCLNHTGKPRVPYWAPIPPSCSPRPTSARPRPRSSTPPSGAWHGRAMRR
jgi:predicted metal-binding membrane protein